MPPPRMLWIGGTAGSGKSTTAFLLAARHGLPVHHLDAYGYAHHRYLPPTARLDDELARGSDGAADAWEATSDARLPLLLADLEARDLGDVPVVVEGPQLRPSLAAGLPVAAAVWLFVPPTVTTRVRSGRADAAADDDAHARIGGLTDRDRVLSDRLRTEVAASPYRAVEVGDPPDRTAVLAAVADALGLGPDTPGLSGSALTRVRRQENAAAVAQVTAYAGARGIAEREVGVMRLELACECGRPGCAERWTGTVADHAAQDTHVAHGPG